MLNPYDILGVTIDSTKEELKKKYYALSLLVHPDKGGSSEDMIIVQKAYKYVLRELSNIDRSLTVEILKERFNSFCLDQKNQVPMFQDIYAEAFDLPKFNEYFYANSNDVFPASFKGGYGNLMDKSELTTKYEDVESKGLENTFSLVNYTPQVERLDNQNVYDMTVGIEGPENYSMENSGMIMTDYKEAFTEKITDTNFDEKDILTYDEFKKLRDETHYHTINSIWSIDGFRNENGELIKDVLRIT